MLNLYLITVSEIGSSAVACCWMISSTIGGVYVLVYVVPAHTVQSSSEKALEKIKEARRQTSDLGETPHQAFSSSRSPGNCFSVMVERLSNLLLSLFKLLQGIKEFRLVDTSGPNMIRNIHEGES